MSVKLVENKETGFSYSEPNMPLDKKLQYMTDLLNAVKGLHVANIKSLVVAVELYDMRGVMLGFGGNGPDIQDLLRLVLKSWDDKLRQFCTH